MKIPAAMLEGKVNNRSEALTQCGIRCIIIGWNIKWNFKRKAFSEMNPEIVYVNL